MVLVDTGTDTSTLGSTGTTICLIEFDGGSTYASQCISEQWAEEHVSLTGVDFLDVHTHLLHDFHTIAETEYDTLLSCTYDVGTVVLGEAQATDRTTYFSVLQYTFSTISEWDNLHAVATDWHTGCQIIHISIADVWSYIAMNPGIQDAGTIDAEQYAETVELCGIVDMCEGIHATLRIVVHITEHTVDHARCTRCTCDFTRVEYVEADSIVRLVAGTVRDRSTLLESEFISSSLADYALYRECRSDVGNHTLIKSEVIEQELGRLLGCKVPHHTLRKTADGSLHLTGKFHGEIIAWEHDLINLVEELWLVLLHPRQLRGCKVARRVEQVAQAEVFSKFTESLLTIRYGTGVAPDDRWAQHLLVLVNANQSVHLIRDTDSEDILTLGTAFCHDFLQRQLGIIPPHLWILLSPSSLHRHDRRLMVWIKRRRYNFTIVYIGKRCLYRTGTYIKA